MMSKMTELGYGSVRVAVNVWFCVNGFGRNVRRCCSCPTERREALARCAALHGWSVCREEDWRTALEIGDIVFMVAILLDGGCEEECKIDVSASASMM